MYPHGYGNPPPSEHPYPPHQNQQQHEDFYSYPPHQNQQEHQNYYQHPPHPAQHNYPGRFHSSSFSPPSSFHRPPAPGAPFNDYAPADAHHPDNRQYSFHPAPPSHQSPYSPSRDVHPPQYDISPSFEARNQLSAAQDILNALPTFGERIRSSLENAFGLPGSQRSSENAYARSSSDHSHSPSVSHHSSSHRSSSHEEKKQPAFESTYEGPGFDYSQSPSIPTHIAAYIENKGKSVVAQVDSPDSMPPPSDVELPKGQLVKLFCKSNRSFNLAVKAGRLAMVEANSEDESQQWIRDDKYSIHVRDSQGHPAFMLINKASKTVLKHASGKRQEVRLAYYSPDIQDDDLFWTESQDFGEGFKSVRMASDTSLNLSVSSNKIEHSSRLILDAWHKKDTQMWKVFPLQAN